MSFWWWVLAVAGAAVSLICLLAWNEANLIRQERERTTRRRREYDALVPDGMESKALHLSDLVAEAERDLATHMRGFYEWPRYRESLRRAKKYVDRNPELGPLLNWLLREWGMGPESSREEMAPRLSGGDCCIGPAAAVAGW